MVYYLGAMTDIKAVASSNNADNIWPAAIDDADMEYLILRSYLYI